MSAAAGIPSGAGATSGAGAPSGAEPVRGRGWIRFLIGFGVLWGTLALLGQVDGTGRAGLAILAAVVLAAVLVERLVYRASWRVAARRLGFGATRIRVLAVAAVVSGLVLLVFPLTAAVTGAELRMVPDWPWILLGIFAFNGLAEELVWRGYAFRRLRTGRSFGRAVLWTMPLVAAAHVPILVQNGPAVGLGSMAVAAITSIPFAYLYETGRGSIWAPALLHTAIDSFKAVAMPPEAAMTFSLLLISISLAVPLLVLCVRRPHLVRVETSRTRRVRRPAVEEQR